MSVEIAMSRVAELQRAFAPPQAPMAGQTAAPATVTNAASFASMLNVAGAGAVQNGPQGGTVGAKILAAVQPEVGVAEQPPGSNDSPRISEYRSATQGAPGPGPWCAYFTSWAASQAGMPLGNNGQGFGSVDQLYSWAQSAGKAYAPGSQAPQPGDLIVWDEHIGVIESVSPDGKISTIEGNSSDQVARRTYGSDGGGALGYVRVG